MEELCKEEDAKFLGMAARINFMSVDCPDLQFPSKQPARDISKPKLGSWNLEETEKDRPIFVVT